MGTKAQLDFFDSLAEGTLTRGWLAGKCPRCGAVGMCITTSNAPEQITAFRRSVAERGWLVVESASQHPLTQCRCSLPRQSHSQASCRAAEAAVPRSTTDRGRVLGFLRERGEYGATDEEMQIALAMNPSTQRPRRIELLKSGWIYATDASRRTRSGSPARVWRACDER